MSKPRSNRRRIDGVLLLDKPYDISSNAALQKVRWLLNAVKAGHTGVLDPLATGLLPICLGEATKFSSYLLDADKAYRATIKLGVTTTTGDIEGDVLLQRKVNVDQETLLAVLQRFRGEISQLPPMYSALKHQGKALYEYARAGIEIPREARTITIHRLELLSLEGDVAVVDVRCSKGSYIRTLAEDIGEALGCGAHLINLRRTATAGFMLEQSHALADLETLPMQDREALLMPADVLVQHLPAMSLTEAMVAKFMQGQAVRFTEKCEKIARFRVYHLGSGRFLGLGEVRADARLYPIRLLAEQAVAL
ncbi:tRNA pseudouridine(55) synthase TruB [Neisseriaceae bacterium TC5R-5]|nr:tRNA pseudouridine(55) synthase TruB [Neisseriaceae bacterium TC5R-5]